MNTRITLWEMPGGVHLPQYKTQSMQSPIGELPLPPQLFLSLDQQLDAPALPIVNIGDYVLAGQLIAKADGMNSANIHASSSGIVSNIENVVLPHASGMSSKCIVIDTDGKHECVVHEQCEDYLSIDRAQLLEKIFAAGMVGLGGAGFPTHVKLGTESTQEIDTLIINGAECEPYITADDSLMQSHADDVIAGTFLLSHILGNPLRLVIGVEDNKPDAIAALQNAFKKYLEEKVSDSTIEIIAIPTKYPSGGSKQITQIITGREIPSGYHSAYVGVISVNVATAAAAWRAVRFGEPLTSRITTVVGKALTVQRNIKVFIGTPIDYVLRHHGLNVDARSRLIIGGSMMGFTLPDARAPILKTTTCILAPDDKEMPPPPPAQACIRCGFCSEVCPASLLPQQLLWYARAEDSDRLQAHNLFDCIECGACSYVCPSNIPLVQYYRVAKGAILNKEIEKEKADRARKRFEFRNSRIAQEETEKEAKRTARKKAAEEAKQKLAEQKNTIIDEPRSPDGETPNAQVVPKSDVVAYAIAKADANELGLKEQKARLERILASARNSLESARAPLVPKNPEFPITQEQLIRQQSRIKQTELKVVDAEKKLAVFLNNVNKPNTNVITASTNFAQAKPARSSEEKLRANIEALEARLTKSLEKAEQARAEASSAASALFLGAEKTMQKIAEAQHELNQLLSSEPAELLPSTIREDAIQDPVNKTKADVPADMSDNEKHLEHIQSLQYQLQKSRDRLAKAESENDANLDAFRSAVTKLEDKVKELSNT